MKDSKKKFIYICLIFISFILGYFICNRKLYDNNDIIENKSTVEVSFNSIAMMLETSSNSGEYALSMDTTWPDSSTYTFNETLSKCENGSTLSYDEDSNIVYMTGTKSDRCYIYFDYDTSSSITDLTLAYQEYGDLNTIISSSGTIYITDIWESTLTNDGYRYVGEDPNNYICFGTTDLDTCINNQDLYMYRIIGIFVDKYGSYHLKLIKKEALDTAYTWHSEDADVDWGENSLYEGLNGDYFLTNSTYSYMQDSTWTELITTWTWTSVNTKTNSKSGVSGVTYFFNNAQNIYYHESNQVNLMTGIIYSYGPSLIIITDYNVGTWTNINSLIGLMYVSDYLLSLGSSSLNYVSNENYSSLATSWMFINNNDSNPPSEYEWTIARHGTDNNGNYFAWHIYSNGSVQYGVNNTSGYVYGTGTISGKITHCARPTFYLNTDVVISSGTGDISNPYILSTD